MIDPALEKSFKSRVDRANHIIQGCLIAILCIIVVLLGLVLWQQQANLDKSREQAAENHKRTRQYVLCVANTLSTPIANRTKAGIDKCTEEADNQTRDADKYGT